MGSQVCAIEDCISSHDAKPSIFRHVTEVPSSCYSEINSTFRNPGPLPSIVEATAFPLDRIGIKVCAEFLKG